MNEMKIVKSSAGSGKTYALVREYLRILMLNPADYRHTLAITFTNKATAEMKSRILSALVDLADGKESALKKSLEEELELDDLQIPARKSLDLILHDYSSFSIHTIDSFFQRIIRGLAREMNLPVTLQLQLNHDEVKEEITERLFDDIGKDEQLTKWITELIEQKLYRDGRWDINQDLYTIAGELLQSHRTEIKTFDKKQIRGFYQELQALRNGFESRLRMLGKSALAEMEKAGVTVEDFSNKTKGPAGYFLKLTAEKPDPEKFAPNVTALNAAEDLSKWVTKTSPLKAMLQPLAEHTLIPLLNEALQEVQENYKRYLGAVTVLRRIYLLGILNDLNKKLAQYRQEKNLLLLSDTPRILNSFISESDTSFVFEKTGNHYRHFLVDEFQDTSGIQWKNLLPLIINSLGSGHFTMVVGDAKQSIYRWRGGDIKLLGGTLAADLKNFSSIVREENLETNYRSRKDIVEFNNELFASVPDLVEREQGAEQSALLQKFYSDGIRQNFAPHNNLPGFVQIRFLEKATNREWEGGEEEDDSAPKKWKEQAMLQMLESMRRLRDQGYSYGDLAILVRMNDEGNAVAAFLAEQGITQVVSSDSLLIKNNPKIIFLVNAFRYIADPGNQIARSELLFSYCTLIQKTTSGQPLHALFTDFKSHRQRKNPAGKAPELFHSASFDDTLFNRLLPAEFTDRIPSLSKLAVYEAAEELCRLFKLGAPEAYVERFLDLVLEYSSRQHSGILNFLRWWDESGQADSCSVVVPEGGNAIRILTVHKSKGLQFPVVLMPFCDWKFTPSAKSLIWVHSDEEPFAAFGELPLHPVKSLGETVFHASYAEETAHALTDNINLLYVAFTRAEQQLMAWCPAPPDTGIKSCSAFIRRILEGNEKLRASFDTELNELKIGDERLRQIRKSEGAVENVRMRSDYEKAAWQEKLTIAARAREYSEEADARKKAVSKGILVHKILAQIVTAEALEKTIAGFVFEGLLDVSETEQLTIEIRRILDHETVREFFLPGKKILSERDILLPGGELFRPDRVLFDEKKVTILDFKTGDESESHGSQLEKYCVLLREMQKKPVEAYLLYLKTGLVKKVV